MSQKVYMAEIDWIPMPHKNKDAFPADFSFSVRDCNSLLVVSRANGRVAQKSIFPLTNGLFCFLPSSDFSKTRLENLKAVSSV